MIVGSAVFFGTAATGLSSSSAATAASGRARPRGEVRAAASRTRRRRRVSAAQRGGPGCAAVRRVVLAPRLVGAGLAPLAGCRGRIRPRARVATARAYGDDARVWQPTRATAASIAVIGAVLSLRFCSENHSGRVRWCARAGGRVTSLSATASRRCSTSRDHALAARVRRRLPRRAVDAKHQNKQTNKSQRVEAFPGS